MGTGRKFNKAPRTRPKKKPAERRRRVELHKSRLTALGADPEKLRHMTPAQLREMLKRPAKVGA
ncbi:hypothetical protein ACFLSJ_02955 [Verrucomicrobiota bacterium]